MGLEAEELVLSPEEASRVEAAGKLGAYSALASEVQTDARRQYGDLNALAAAWRQLTPEGRLHVQLVLAQQAEGCPDFLNYDLSVIESDAFRKRRGAPPTHPGLRELVGELFEVWCARGNPREIGQLYRIKGDHEINPSRACEFVAHHALNAIPELGGSEADAKARLLQACRTVYAHLQALGEIGRKSAISA